MGEWLCCQLWRQPGCYSAMCSRTWKTYFKRLQLSHKDDVDNLKWALLPYFQSCCSFTSQSQQVQTAICQLPREIWNKRRIRCILVWPWSDPGQNTLLPLPLQPPVSLLIFNKLKKKWPALVPPCAPWPWLQRFAHQPPHQAADPAEAQILNSFDIFEILCEVWSKWYIQLKCIGKEYNENWKAGCGYWAVKNASSWKLQQFHWNPILWQRLTLNDSNFSRIQEPNSSIYILKKRNI